MDIHVKKSLCYFSNGFQNVLLMSPRLLLLRWGGRVRCFEGDSIRGDGMTQGREGEEPTGGEAGGRGSVPFGTGIPNPQGRTLTAACLSQQKLRSKQSV